MDDEYGELLAAWFCDTLTDDERAALEQRIDELRLVDPDAVRVFWWMSGEARHDEI